MAVEMLSYAELGERLKISPEAARALVKRHRLPRSRSNTGKTLVQVDLTEISHSPVTRAPPTPAGHQVVTALKDHIATLQADLLEMKAIADGHRADFERETDRSNRLQADLLEMKAIADGHRAEFGRETDRSNRLMADLLERKAIADGHRADFEQETDRSNRLMAELLKASNETAAAREKAAYFAGKLSTAKQRWWRKRHRDPSSSETMPQLNA